MKLDVLGIYIDRIKVIEDQQRKAQLKKNWPVYYRLKSEKETLQQIINKKRTLPTISRDRLLNG